jgi:hypothetical protein
VVTNDKAIIRRARRRRQQRLLRSPARRPAPLTADRTAPRTGGSLDTPGDEAWVEDPRRGLVHSEHFDTTEAMTIDCDTCLMRRTAPATTAS